MSLTNFAERFLFVSGGSQAVQFSRKETRITETVDKYDMLTDNWASVPSLNIARTNHSSCTLAGIIYVFCGETNKKITPRPTIERFDAQSHLKGRY